MIKRVALALPAGLFGILVGAFLLAPTIFSAYYSIGESRYFTFPATSFSLTWYEQFFRSEKFMSAAFRTALLAAVVTPLCLIVALMTAHALVHSRLRAKRLLDALALSPLVVPGVVTGIAFLSLFRIFGLELGLVRMGLAMMVVCLPFALRAIAANYQNVDPATEEAARDLGASAMTTYLKVTLPQLKPGILAAAIFVFVEVVDNFSVNVFLADLRSDTLPITAYQHVRDFDDPLVAVMSTILSILTLFLVLVFQRMIGLDRIASTR
jgi:putative spermidine/putrescine transport system permease protein